jgi:hypothetical protein
MRLVVNIPTQPDVTPGNTPTLVAETTAEWTALMHLRGQEHFGPVCPLCSAFRKGIRAGRRIAYTEVSGA